MADQPDFISKAFHQSGRYIFVPGGPEPEIPNPEFQTITVFEEVDLAITPGSNTAAWMLKRVERQEPVDFLEYSWRKN